MSRGRLLRSRRGATALLLAAMILAAPAGAGTARAAATASTTESPEASGQAVATTRVTYLGGPSVYVEAGRDDGLRPGDTLEVVRDGKTIATLTVTYLSAHRAACTVTNASETIVVGDQVRYVPQGAVAPPVPPPGAPASPPAPGGQPPEPAWTRRGSGLHGRVGVRYLAVKDRTSADGGFSQRGIDLWLRDQGLGPIDLFVDVRARRTYATRTGDVNEVDSLNNVYRLSASWHLDDPRQTITFGRQFAPSLSVISLFDGVLYDFNGGRWSLGGFAGTEPEPIDLEVSGDIRDYGGYWQYRGTTAAARRWEVTSGLVASYEDGEPNREFLFVQGRYHGPRLSGFVVEEIDYYRGWKVDDAGESTLSFTSTFANLHFRAGEHVTLYGGYDNRRNVRLFRDQVTPVTEFDDSHRQGGWGGASFRMGEHFELGGDLRRSTGGPSGTADGYSLNAAVDRLTSANVGFTGRGTHYANDESDGWLYGLDIGFDIATRVHLEVGAGHLDETSERDPLLDRSTDWVDLEIDVILGRRWFLLLSGERYQGSDEDNDQSYASVSYRF